MLSVRVRSPTLKKFLRDFAGFFLSRNGFVVFFELGFFLRPEPSFVKHARFVISCTDCREAQTVCCTGAFPEAVHRHQVSRSFSFLQQVIPLRNRGNMPTSRANAQFQGVVRIFPPIQRSLPGKPIARGNANKNFFIDPPTNKQFQANRVQYKFNKKNDHLPS